MIQNIILEPYKQAKNIATIHLKAMCGTKK